jgi:hypothetical protein
MKRYERLASQIGDLIQRGDLLRLPYQARYRSQGTRLSRDVERYRQIPGVSACPFCAIPFLRRLALIRFFSVHVILVFRKDLSHSHPLCEPCASSA